MSARNKQNRAMLVSMVVSATLLSACGIGPSDEGVMPDEPAMGQAIEASATGTPSSAPISQAPMPAEQTPPTTESNSNTNSQPEPTQTSTPMPETTPDSTTEPADPIPEPEPTPISVSCTTSASNMQNSALYLINQARSVARRCGDQSFAAAPPVAWNSKLEAAVRVHSTDMAEHNFFSHSGSDGSSSAQRATNQDYNWRTIGENIAAGQPTTEAVIQDWIDSPGHCANIMNPDFEEIAVACIENNASQYRQYWTNALGTTF